MKSIQRSLLTTFALALPLILLGGCGEDEPERSAAPAAPSPAQEEAAPPPADEPEEEVRYSGETPEGIRFNAQMGGDVVMPESVPQDFPMYPGARVFSAMEAGDTSLVTVDVAKDGRALYRFYIDELRKAGWNVTNQVNLGNAYTLRAVKDSHDAAVQIQETASGSRVSIAFSPTT